MATIKAESIPQTESRASQVQMNLRYAQDVAAQVLARRRAELQRRIAELQDLPVTHPLDVDLREALLRNFRAELKQFDEEK